MTDKSTDESPRADDAGDFLWGAKQIAAYLRTSERKCRYLISAGLIPFTKRGASIVARRKDLDECLRPTSGKAA